MTPLTSVTLTPDGVQIVGNDSAIQMHYMFMLTWDELFELAREKGKAITTQEMAKLSSKGIRDIMEGQ